METDRVVICKCDKELLLMFDDWLCERDGEVRIRVKFECCRCGRVAVVRVVDAKEDQ